MSLRLKRSGGIVERVSRDMERLHSIANVQALRVSLSIFIFTFILSVLEFLYAAITLRMVKLYLSAQLSPRNPFIVGDFSKQTQLVHFFLSTFKFSTLYSDFNFAETNKEPNLKWFTLSFN